MTEYAPLTLDELREFLEDQGYAIRIYRLHFNDHIETYKGEDVFLGGWNKIDLPVKTWMIEKFEGSDHIIFLNVFIKEDE